MATVLVARGQAGFTADAALDASVRLWWLVTAVGQWVFMAYVAVFFSPLLVQGGLEGLKRAPLFNGFIPGDAVGNLAVAGHILLAVIILGGGPLQLLPQIRARFPGFHRWLGRTWLLTVFASAVAGLWLIWTRPLFGLVVTNVATSIDGMLIIIFAGIALRYAIARNITAHRRWALRLFLVASAVWTLRIGFQTWSFFTGGIGIDEQSFSGPFVVTWHFGQYLLPLAVLELYFRARESASTLHRAAMAAGLFVISILMSIGICLATVNSWLPKLAGAT